MLLKWIRCTVGARSREAFSRAQTQWSALQGVAGFRGQVGGWSAADPAMKGSQLVFLTAAVAFALCFADGYVQSRLYEKDVKRQPAGRAA